MKQLSGRDGIYSSLMPRFWAAVAALWVLWLCPHVCHAAPRYVPSIDVIGRWERPPLVRVCSTAPVGVVDVRRAIHRVTRRTGARFRGLTFGRCQPWPGEGEVWIVGSIHGVGGPVLGATLPTVRADGVIVSALISLDVGTSLVLDHELLHALGLAHLEEPGHLLHPVRALAGRSWVGVREALR